MAKLIVFLLGLAVLGGVAYWYVQGRSAGSGDREAPAARLEQVREKARDIEKDAQKRADDLLEKTSP